jgi:hypothetical protein
MVTVTSQVAAIAQAPVGAAAEGHVPYKKREVNWQILPTRVPCTGLPDKLTVVQLANSFPGLLCDTPALS